MPRHPETLVDSAIDRELEALLDVAPSGEFAARVRTAVAAERPAVAVVAVVAGRRPASGRALRRSGGLDAPVGAFGGRHTKGATRVRRPPAQRHRP